MLERSVFQEHVIGPLERHLLKRPRSDEERKGRIACLEVEEMDRRLERAECAFQLGVGMDAPRDHAGPNPPMEVAQAIEILGNVADVLDIGIAEGAKELRAHAGQMLERILGPVEVATRVEGTHIGPLAVRPDKNGRRLHLPRALRPCS